MIIILRAGGLWLLSNPTTKERLEEKWYFNAFPLPHKTCKNVIIVAKKKIFQCFCKQISRETEHNHFAREHKSFVSEYTTSQGNIFACKRQ